MKTLPLLLVLLLAGCAKATAPTPPAALAPGYLSADDQNVGRSLAAVNAFVLSEKAFYQCTPPTPPNSCLTPAQRTAEKPYLNGLITATDVANAAYTSFHQGTQTLDAAQAALAKAQQAQSTLAAAKGLK